MDTLTQPQSRERASIVLDASLHRRCKAVAARMGLPLNRLAASALEAELQRLERLQERSRR